MSRGAGAARSLRGAIPFCHLSLSVVETENLGGRFLLGRTLMATIWNLFDKWLFEAETDLFQASLDGLEPFI